MSACAPLRCPCGCDANLEPMFRYAPYRTCPTCGTGYYVPPELTANYYAPGVRPQEWEMAAFAGKTGQWTWLLNIAGVEPPARILDVGSGWGHFVDWAVGSGYEAYGVEPEAWARDSSLQPDRIVPHIADAEAGNDVVTLFDVLEHAIEPLPLAASALTRLKPGGRLIVGGPSFDAIKKKWWLYRRRPARFDSRVGPTKHVSQFTERGLRSLLARAGATHVERVHPPLAKGHSRAIAAASRIPYLRDGMFLIARRD